jgi:CRP/FNR family transcriptional regulator
MLPSLLAAAPAAERERFVASASLARLPAGHLAIGLSSAPEMMVFPTAGAVRVYLIGTEGREVTLYRVEPGSSCVLSASCILGASGFPAVAQVESDLVAWVVPAAVFRDWVDRSAFWREFVFRLLGERLAAVLARLEETTFGRVDARLARLLLAGGAELQVTHQELANDIGTAREVVSRILERWKAEGWLESRRGSVRVLDPDALGRISGGSGRIGD